MALLPPPFADSACPLELVTQGAEAFLYRTAFLTPTRECALKYRPSKAYRHPILDRRLTRQRILAEARVLARCRKEGGLDVPAVLALDWEAGWLATEWVDGPVVRRALQDTAADPRDRHARPQVVSLLRRIGVAVARLHAFGIVHGDLTTSNMMLRPTGSRRSVASDRSPTSTRGALAGDVVLIDFGLAQQTQADEDRAVDLYVLERAFASTHPEAEHLFETLLDAYGTSYPHAHIVIRRLLDVRMRGRKKSMLG